MSIAQNFPALKPSLLLDFSNTEQLDPRITFTRASTGTYYDGKTVAKAEQNLVTFSEQFDNAAWTKQNVTVTANATTAPDGATTADSFVGTSATSAVKNITNAVFMSAVPYVFSCYVRNNGGNFIQVLLSAQTGHANFDISTGAVGSTSEWGSSATITSVGGGWFRITVAFTPSAAATNYYPIMAIVDSSSAARGAASTSTAGFFLWGAQLEQRSAVTAYTATTTQPITNYIPVLLTAASGVARFEHNPTTGESLGLEIEESRTNLVLRSEEFDNASWTKNRVSITANTIVAPDGALTGDKLVENTDTNTHFMNQDIALADNTVYTASVYMKAAERLWGYITVINKAASNRGAYFDLSTGTVGTVTAGETATITAVGNGWYRCTLTVNVGTGATTPQMRIWTASANGTSNYTGNGYSGIYIWGAQLEAGAFATSYIPTVASQVTRAADAASMTGTNFSSWYSAEESSVFADFVTSAPASVAAAAFAISNGSIDQMINTYVQGAMSQQVRNTTTQASLSPSGTFSAGVRVKSVVAAAINDFAGTANGGAVVTDTVGVMPLGVDRFQIGSNGSGTVANVLNGTIKKIAYYPVRIQNNQLQALTS